MLKGAPPRSPATSGGPPPRRERRARTRRRDGLVRFRWLELPPVRFGCYLPRSPLAQHRFRPSGDGRVRLALKTPWADGTSHYIERLTMEDGVSRRQVGTHSVAARPASENGLYVAFYAPLSTLTQRPFFGRSRPFTICERISRGSSMWCWGQMDAGF